MLKPALREVQESLMDYKGTGCSIMECFLYSDEVLQLMDETRQILRDYLEVPENFTLLMMAGGASNQFDAICYNLRSNDREMANYLHTGHWSQRALDEAQKHMVPHCVAKFDEDE